jgi:integrase
MWDHVAKRAKVEGVTLHSLRHWFASSATEWSYSDLITGALPGHTKRGISDRKAPMRQPGAAQHS